MNEVTNIDRDTTSSMALQRRGALEPSTLTEAIRFAEVLAKSSMVPKEFVGNAPNILVAIQWGRELGLGPMQAMQNIAVINGRPTIWGDAMLALVRGSPVCAYVRESIEGDGDDMKAICRAKRVGDDTEITGEFSVTDAKKAGLWQTQARVSRRKRDGSGTYEADNDSPWYRYPKRMLQARARGFCLRDAFPDVLHGIISAEEAKDIPAAPFAGTTIDHDPSDVSSSHEKQPNGGMREFIDSDEFARKQAAPVQSKPSFVEKIDRKLIELKADRLKCIEVVKWAAGKVEDIETLNDIEQLQSVRGLRTNPTYTTAIDLAFAEARKRLVPAEKKKKAPRPVVADGSFNGDVWDPENDDEPIAGPFMDRGDWADSFAGFIKDMPPDEARLFREYHSEIIEDCRKDPAARKILDKLNMEPA